MLAAKKILRRHSGQASNFLQNTGGKLDVAKADMSKSPSFVSMLGNLLHGHKTKKQSRRVNTSRFSVGTSVQDLLPRTATHDNTPSAREDLLSQPSSYANFYVTAASPPAEIPASRPVSKRWSDNLDMDRAYAYQSLVIRMGENARRNRGYNNAAGRDPKPTVPTAADVFATEDTVRDGQQPPRASVIDTATPVFNPIYIPNVEEVTEAQRLAVLASAPEPIPRRYAVRARVDQACMDQTLRLDADAVTRANIIHYRAYGPDPKAVGRAAQVVRKFGVMRELLKDASPVNVDLGVSKVLAKAMASPLASPVKKLKVKARKARKYAHVVSLYSSPRVRYSPVARGLKSVALLAGEVLLQGL